MLSVIAVVAIIAGLILLILYIRQRAHIKRQWFVFFVFQCRNRMSILWLMDVYWLHCIFTKLWQQEIVCLSWINKHSHTCTVINDIVLAGTLNNKPLLVIYNFFTLIVIAWLLLLVFSSLVIFSYTTLSVQSVFMGFCLIQTNDWWLVDRLIDWYQTKLCVITWLLLLISK